MNGVRTTLTRATTGLLQIPETYEIAKSALKVGTKTRRDSLKPKTSRRNATLVESVGRSEVRVREAISVAKGENPKTSGAITSWLVFAFVSKAITWLTSSFSFST